AGKSGSHSSALCSKRSYSSSGSMTMRWPFTVTRLAAGRRDLLSVLINVPPIADPVHDNQLALHTEANAVIAGAQPIPACQVAPQRLRSAHGRPLFQSRQDVPQPPLDALGKGIGLLHCLGRQLHVSHDVVFPGLTKRSSRECFGKLG